jgi:hypothetical protein
MTQTESKVWIQRTIAICKELGLNKNNARDFKRAYEIAVNGAK